MGHGHTRIDTDNVLLNFRYLVCVLQIKEKKYFEKYQGTDKEIYLFGVEFADRNVGEWVVEKMKKQPRVLGSGSWKVARQAWTNITELHTFTFTST